MKKLLILLLFIPLVIFSQNSNGSSTISFNDIMSINSSKTFVKLMIENNYASIGKHSFSLNPNEIGASTSFAYYYSIDNTFEFQFARSGTMYTGTPQEKETIVENPYDDIFQKVKRRCKFVQIITKDNDNYACYDCWKAKFKGLIGFTTTNASGNSTGIVTIFSN